MTILGSYDKLYSYIFEHDQLKFGFVWAHKLNNAWA